MYRGILLAAALALWVAGCSTSPPEGLPPGPPGARSSAAPPRTAPPPGAPAAPAQPPAPRFLPLDAGDYQYSVGSENRHYALHVPPGYDGTRPLAAVIVLHGRGGSAVTARSFGFSEDADRSRFFVLYPEAVPPTRTWFTGLEETGTPPADDVDYIKQVLADAANLVNLDVHRLYAVGYSNGGTLAVHLAGTLGRRIAAVAAVNADIAVKDRNGALVTVARPSQPVSALFIHGREDRASPYAGGPSAVLGGNNAIGAREGADWWAQSMDCATPPKADQTDEIERLQYTGCRDGAVAVLISYAGGHEWPKTLALDPKGRPQPTDDCIMEFFSSKLNH